MERSDRISSKGPFKYYVINEVGGWSQKMAIFDDLQYCKSSKRRVGGPKKVKKNDDVILEWSPRETASRKKKIYINKEKENLLCSKLSLVRKRTYYFF